MKFKEDNKTSSHWNSAVEGSTAIQVNFDTDIDEVYNFNQFQKNLSQLQKKVSQLSFMTDEVQSVLKKR